MKIVTLKKRAEFLRVSSKGCSFKTPSVIILMLKKHSPKIWAIETINETTDEIKNDKIKKQSTDETRSSLRFGFTASKKVGKANKRNFAKRRLKELARYCCQRFHLAPKNPYDIIFIATSKTPRVDFDFLKKDVEFAFSRCYSRVIKT
jgi:ribonuclease P protein component